MSERRAKMKNTTIAKIFVDIALVVLYLELMYAYDASPLFHEVAGIGIVVLFVIHYVLNWKALKAMFTMARKKKLSVSRWILLVSDIILPFCTAFCVVTGLLVARILFVGPCFGDVVYFHDTSANVCLWIMVVHLVFHARYLLGYARQVVRAEFMNKAFGTVAACVMVGVLIGACFTTSSSEDESPVALPANSESKSTPAKTPEVVVNRTEKESSYASSTDDVLTDAPSSSSTEQITQGEATEEESTTIPVCTLCRKMCPVTNLLCDRGVQWAQSNNYL